MLEMHCPECGFGLDPVNESQQVCPACGRQPARCEPVEDDSGIVAALGDVASLADHLPHPLQGVDEALIDDPEVDYPSDPELDLILADAEAHIKALFERPILVAGNHLVN